MIPELASNFLFATTVAVNKSILVNLSPLFWVSIRTLAAGIPMFLFILLFRRSFTWTQFRKDLLLLLAISFFTKFLASFLKAYSLKHMVSSKQTLIGCLDPFVAAIFAYFLFGDRLTKMQIVGMFISFGGIVFLLVATAPFEEIAASWGIISLPEIAAFASMIASRYGWLLARNLMCSNRYTSLEMTSINMFLSGLWGISFSYALGICDFCSVPPSGEFWLVFSYAVIIGNIIGYTIYAQFLKMYPVTHLALYGLSYPVFVHLLGPFILHEPLSPVFFIAFGLVFLGIFIFTRQQKAAAKSPVSQ